MREPSQHQHERVMSASALIVTLFALLFLLPIAVAAVRYWLQRDGIGWRTADRSSIGHLPPANSTPEAVLRVFAARTVRWRGAFATHCWIVFKPENATAYTRYDCTAWGEPIRMNGFEPDGRWFGRAPEVVYAADGPAASAMIPRMQAAIRDYAFRDLGDYRALARSELQYVCRCGVGCRARDRCLPAADGDRQGLSV